MQRIQYSNDDEILKPLFYQASSIADMLEGRDLIASDSEKKLKQHPILYAFTAATEFPAKALFKILGRNYVFPGAAIVYIPLVRHSSEQEKNEDPEKVTIQDVTAELEVDIPNQLLCGRLRDAGLNIYPDSVKTDSWTSDIVLGFTCDSFRDRYFVLHLFNRHVRDPAKEGLAELVAKIAQVGIR